MEILETNLNTIERLEHSWNAWLVFDNKPRILERGTDFMEEATTLRRYLLTEAAKHGLDAVVKILDGNRILYQVFHPSGKLPRLPELTDARHKYPWAKWLNGNQWYLAAGDHYDTTYVSMRAYIYKNAKSRGLHVTVSQMSGGLSMRAYKEES